MCRLVKVERLRSMFVEALVYLLGASVKFPAVIQLALAELWRGVVFTLACEWE